MEVRYVSDEILEMMKYYEKQADTAKGIAVFDFVLNIINFWLFMDPFFGLLAVVSFIGYNGAETYHKGMILVYLVYQYLLTLLKCSYIYVSIVVLHDTKLIIISSTAAFMQMIVTVYIQRFYNKICVLRSPQSRVTCV